MRSNARVRCLMVKGTFTTYSDWPYYVAGLSIDSPFDLGFWMGCGGKGARVGGGGGGDGGGAVGTVEGGGGGEGGEDCTRGRGVELLPRLETPGR